MLRLHKRDMFSFAICELALDVCFIHTVDSTWYSNAIFVSLRGSPSEYMCVSPFNYFKQRTRDMRTIINESIHVVSLNYNFPLFTFFLLPPSTILWQFVSHHTLFQLINSFIRFGSHNLHKCKRSCTIWYLSWSDNKIHTATDQTQI